MASCPIQSPKGDYKGATENAILTASFEQK